MADTLANIKISSENWVDLYDESSISTGTQLIIQNVGQAKIMIHTGASAPGDDDGFQVLPINSDPYVNQESSSGEWAKSVGVDSYINVGEAQ